MTTEQMVREILESVKSDPVLFEMYCSGANPQTFTCGDLVFPANRLNQILGEKGRHILVNLCDTGRLRD